MDLIVLILSSETVLQFISQVAEIKQNVSMVEVNDFFSNGYVLSIILFIGAILMNTVLQAGNYLVIREGVRLRGALQVWYIYHLYHWHAFVCVCVCVCVCLWACECMDLLVFANVWICWCYNTNNVLAYSTAVCIIEMIAGSLHARLFPPIFLTTYKRGHWLRTSEPNKHTGLRFFYVFNQTQDNLIIYCHGPLIVTTDPLRGMFHATTADGFNY